MKATSTPQKVLEPISGAFTSQSLDESFTDRQLDRAITCDVMGLCKTMYDSANLENCLNTPINSKINFVKGRNLLNDKQKIICATNYGSRNVFMCMIGNIPMGN